MKPTHPAVLSPKEVAQTLAIHWRCWLIPTAVVGVLAVGYALVRPATWEASQALIVRDEAINNETGPGKFIHTDEMKTVQETIMELVKSRGVLTAALRQVGPPADYRKDASAWPTPRDVANLRGNVKLTPPNGAEFGKTEVFYLQVEDGDRGRTIELSEAICGSLLKRFQRLRDAKAQSMIDELVKTVHLSKADLNDSTARLTAIEKQVGSDLAELRTLDDGSSGESVLRRTIGEVRNELRQIEAVSKTNTHLLALLQEAQEDPGRLVAMPNRLLQSQPALRRLKDGLIDLQLGTAGLLGRMTDDHPLVRAAKSSEEEVGRHLHNELEIAVRGVKLDLQMGNDRVAMLRDQLVELTGRLDLLAGVRAVYANQVAETENRTELLRQAEQNLAEARATHASAQVASLISRIDSPDAGIYPIGPGRTMIALAGIAGGLLIGLAVVLLTVESSQPAPATEQPTATPVAEAGAPTPVVPAAPAIGPVTSPTGGLSFKQALQRIHYGNRA